MGNRLGKSVLSGIPAFTWKSLILVLLPAIVIAQGNCPGPDCYTHTGSACQSVAGGNCGGPAGCTTNQGLDECTNPVGIRVPFWSIQIANLAHNQCVAGNPNDRCFTSPTVMTNCFQSIFWSQGQCGGAQQCLLVGTVGSCTANAGDCCRIDPAN